MAIRRGFIGLAIVSIVVIGIMFLGSVPQATAETLKFKAFNHVTKQEMFPIPDVEGHVVGVSVREGVAVFENGELGWHTVTQSLNFIKGAGSLDSYFVCTFLDGSTFIVRAKGTVEATPQGVSSAAKSTGDIIGGTGRFQGIKGTWTVSVKLFPPEKGELGPKSLAEHSLVYTLPGK
ncbi:MAG TPA: hypothetical protein VKF36_07250 [Syntrophorhabdales bacterium]|nr:hypothetical protein [Syntrophorhabdales bacterium]